MTNPTPNSLSPQGVPNNSARCLGSRSYEDGTWHWREGCDDCQRRIPWAGEGWMDPPPIIAFECEYRIGPDEIVAQGEHAPGPEPPSPAAQAVLDAYFTHADLLNREVSHEEMIAAALRALADQLRLELPLGDTDADAGVFAAHHVIYSAILTIATELEAAQ